MTPNEVIDKLKKEFNGKMDNKLTLLEMTDFIRSLKMTSNKDISDFIKNNSEEYITFRLDSNYKHKNASYKALKLFCETIAITDGELYEILNEKYDLRCVPMNGDALLSYVYEKMKQDTFLFDCLHSLFDSIHLDLNNEINKLRFPKNKKTKKPLIGTFLKLTSIKE